jgi:quinol-cytochrome oxidoreductase complex cytochrome b subunit
MFFKTSVELHIVIKHNTYFNLFLKKTLKKHEQKRSAGMDCDPKYVLNQDIFILDVFFLLFYFLCIYLRNTKLLILLRVVATNRVETWLLRTTRDYYYY